MIGLIAAFFFIIAYFYLSSQKTSPLEKEIATDIFRGRIKRTIRRYFQSEYDRRISGSGLVKDI